MSFVKAGLISEVFFGPTGRPINKPVVTVVLKGTSTAAELFTDEDKGTPVANPVKGDKYGQLQIWVDPGVYTCTAAGAPTARDVMVPRHPDEPGGTAGDGAFVTLGMVGAPNGVASLDADGHVPSDELVLR